MRLALVLCMLCFGNAAIAQQTVTLQLPWSHQFQFAGYYAAELKGFYAEEGLEVEILPGLLADGSAVNAVAEVVFQRADFGVSRSDLLVHHARGLPVVMLANIMQRSPVVFITLEQYGITRLEDIVDVPVMLPLTASTPGTIIDVEVVAALAKAGIDTARLDNSPPSWDLEDLQTGKAKMIMGFSTDEVYALEQRGAQPVVISPRDYGIDFYGDLLFTSEATLRNSPETVESFRRAVLNGWRYAMENPEVIANYILQAYPPPQAEKDKDFLLNEAMVMNDYIQSDLIEIGYSNVERWQRILDIYRDIGLTDPVDLKHFVYQTRMQEINKWHLPAIAVLLILFALSSLLVVRLFQSRRMLEFQMRHREKRESQLQRQAETDPLTGLDNRRRFNLELESFFWRAQRHQFKLAVIMLDIDHFKIINDTHGHPVGDKVLCELARMCRDALRESDFACRYGGEEFAFLLPDSELHDAIAIAERLVSNINNTVVLAGGVEITFSVSVGVTELKTTDRSAEQLIQRADKLMYQAKRSGRNAIHSILQ